jgi:hypothetical protein
MRRIIVIPAVLVGCLIVIWVGTVAAAKMPPQALLTPTLTAIANTDLSTHTIDPKVETSLAPVDQNDALICTLSPSLPAAVRQWCPAIERYAHETGLPVNLIAAVVLQESGGDPLAYSSSGAVGLMQVMPRDGLAADFMCINGPCFAGRPTTAELEDPDFNLAYGSRMLADLYTKFSSYREALYRYGPMDMGYTYADLVLNIWNTYQ